MRIQCKMLKCQEDLQSQTYNNNQHLLLVNFFFFFPKAIKQFLFLGLHSLLVCSRDFFKFRQRIRRKKKNTKNIYIITNQLYQQVLLSNFIMCFFWLQKHINKMTSMYIFEIMCRAVEYRVGLLQYNNIFVVIIGE